MERGGKTGGSESSDANFVIKTDDLVTTCKPISPSKAIWRRSGPVIDNARQYISFQGPESYDNWLSLTESNLFKREAFAKYQMKMIPLSAWVSLPVGALLIGLEYIAPAVVTAASNVSPLLLLSSPLHSTFCAAVYC